MLAQHGVAHVYNHWSYMPPLAEQHKRMGTFTAPFTVLRLLTPLKISYEAAKKWAGQWSWREESNLQPAVYKSANRGLLKSLTNWAIPLSYLLFDTFQLHPALHCLAFDQLRSATFLTP